MAGRGLAIRSTSVYGLSRRLAAILAFAAGLQPAFAASAPSKAPAERRPTVTLEGALAKEVQAAQRVSRDLGVHVLDLAAQREVYGYQAEQPRILASNTKLLTTAAALAELGPDYVFATRVLVQGEMVGEAWVGDFAVVGAGDPNLSGRFHDGDPYAIFRGWARALAARGAKRVTGDLVLVNGIFAEPRVHPDWPRDQLTTWYEAPVDALSFSDNCVLVRIRPGAKSGSLAIVETVPKLDYFTLRSTARTAEKTGRLTVSRQDDADVIVVSGTIGRRSGPIDVWVAVHDPGAYFAAALRGAFAEEGIEIQGITRPVHGLPGGAWEEIARQESDLATTLAVTNKRSQNFYAECLAKLLGYRLEGEGSWPAAVRAVTALLSELGVDPAEVRLADGSGMSRANFASPRAVTRVLERMYFHAFGRDYVRSLPFSGEDGLSWERRLAQAPYRGNVFAKTGTLTGVSTLSGYAKGVSGRVYAFSILINQVRSNAAAHDAQDRILRALIDRG